MLPADVHDTWSTRLPLALSVLGLGFLFFALKINEKPIFLAFFGAPTRDTFWSPILEPFWAHFGCYFGAIFGLF